MTKQDEVKLLKFTVENWPADSYLKAPLNDLIPFCEREIGSDVEPDIIGAILHFQNELKRLKEEYSQLQKSFITLDNDRSKAERDLTRAKNELRDMKNHARNILDL
jgi:uncharacterized protein (DUF342 family)